MELIKENIKINKKEFPVRIHKGNKPEYVFITHHGVLSNKTSWRYFEKWVGEKAIVVNYDARLNGENKMKASRLMGTYTRDLRDVVRWVKEKYKNIKIVTLGSSWGATVVIDHAKKYKSEIFKTIAWSIPYKFTASEDNDNIKKTKKIKNEKNDFKETSNLGYAWKFALMLLLNINAKSYTKIDLNKTAHNKTLKRINRINKPKATPVKLFWAIYKFILLANKSMIKMNKKYQNSELLYFQSTKDSYLKNKKIKQLKNNSGKGLKINILDEGKHAFQWETINNLNERVFNILWSWLNE